MRQETQVYWRINEQNPGIALKNLRHRKRSVAPHYPVLSVWQRIELTGNKNMPYRIGTMWMQPYFKLHQFVYKARKRKEVFQKI